MSARALAWLCALLACPASALAQVPARLPLHGVLGDSGGAPIEGEVQVVFALYARARGGEPLYRETHTLSVEAGHFAVLLGGHEPLDLSLFAAGQEMYIGVTVEDDDEAEPRMQLGSVPYAAAAQLAHEAVTLEGTGLDELQRRIVGSCQDGEVMIAVESDGSVRCVSLSTLAGPPGPTGPPGPPGPIGPAGPPISFDCQGDAVSALDGRGRPTCVPRVTAKLAAGSGVVVDDCQADTCRVSLAAESVGMAEANLPMESAAVNSKVQAGAAFYQVGSAFSPPVDGQCMVVATFTVDDAARAVNTGRVADVRVGYTEDDQGPAVPPGIGTYPALTPDAVAVASSTAHDVVPVVAGRTYRFGCHATASGDWVDAKVACQVSRFCQ